MVGSKCPSCGAILDDDGTCPLCGWVPEDSGISDESWMDEIKDLEAELKEDRPACPACGSFLTEGTCEICGYDENERGGIISGIQIDKVWSCPPNYAEEARARLWLNYHYRLNLDMYR